MSILAIFKMTLNTNEKYKKVGVIYEEKNTFSYSPHGRN